MTPTIQRRGRTGKSGPCNISAGVHGQDGLLIFGIHPVREALSVAPSAVEVIYCLPTFGRKKAQKALLNLARSRGARVEEVRDFHGLSITSGTVHQGIAAIVQPVWEISQDQLLSDLQALLSRGIATEFPVLVMVDSLTDPQNLGAIIRSSVAFGAYAVVVPSRKSAPVTGAVVKASAGIIFSARVCRIHSILTIMDRFHEMGILIAGLDGRATEPIYSMDFTGPVAVVVGAEDRGIRKSVARQCAVLASIPLAPQVDSLNASAALAIALYEVKRQRVSGL